MITELFIMFLCCASLLTLSISSIIYNDGNHWEEYKELREFYLMRDYKYTLFGRIVFLLVCFLGYCSTFIVEPFTRGGTNILDWLFISKKDSK